MGVEQSRRKPASSEESMARDLLTFLQLISHGPELSDKDTFKAMNLEYLNVV